MNRVVAILLFAICAAILLGFTFVSTTYWYVLDVLIFIVSIAAGVLLWKKEN